MTPAESPLPTAWYFPFHPASGNHTSALMSESVVGVIVSRTRQNARGALNGAAPAGTISVLVILAAGIASPARLSHEVSARARPGTDNSASRRTLRFMAEFLRRQKCRRRLWGRLSLLIISV